VAAEARRADNKLQGEMKAVAAAAERATGERDAAESAADAAR
jgi:hypothetical protein